MAEDGPPLALQVRRKDFVADDGSRIHVLDDVAFQLPRGSFTCLIGPSGCGKTTTMRILMGLDDAYEGWIDGAFRELRVAAAFQEPRLLPWRTLEQNVRLALPRDGEPADVARALSEVGLEGLGHRYPAQLSLGQARRAALARAFAVRPEILYLDEPFVSLDEATARRLRELTLELCRTRPVTVLMVTHNVREAVQLADRIVLLTQRPARVAGEVVLDVPRPQRTPGMVQEMAADLARRFPAQISL